MAEPKTVLRCTFLIWALATAFYAYFYVMRRTGLAGAEGYEQDWDWQLFFFALTRLPILLLLLLLIIWWEAKHLRLR